MSRRFAICSIALLIFSRPILIHAADTKTPPPATSAAPLTIKEGMSVKMEYTLTVDGAVVDSTKGKEPFAYRHGRRQIIPGLERALAGLRVGDHKEVTVKPEDGYGKINPALIMEVTKASLPQGITPKAGVVFRYADDKGRPIRAAIKEVKDTTVVLDGNHPFAGKTLTFNVTIVDIQPASSS